MTKPISVQLYSVQEQLSRDFEGTFERIAELGYEAVELTMPVGTPPEANEAMDRELRALYGNTPIPPAPTAEQLSAANLKRVLDNTGLKVSAAHVYLPDGDTAEEIFDAQELLGNTMLVGGLGFDSPSDLDSVERMAERFNVAAERARRRGMRVGYHNHHDEVAPLAGGRSGLELFYDRLDPEVFAEIDIYWAHVGGRNPAELIRSLGNRAELLHVKDAAVGFGDRQAGPTTPSSPLGQGALDVGGALDAATSASWWTVEVELLPGEKAFTVLAENLAYLNMRGA